MKIYTPSLYLSLDLLLISYFCIRLIVKKIELDNSLNCKRRVEIPQIRGIIWRIYMHF